MKTTLYLLVTMLLVLSGCSTNDSTEQETLEAVIETPYDVLADTTFHGDSLTGIYTGSFGNNPIRLVLTYVSANRAVGYNVVKGLVRNISGNVTCFKDSILMTLREPGDNEYDGTFIFSLNRTDKTITGRWIANATSIAPKLFQLKPFEHRYVENYGEEPVTNKNFTSYFYSVSDSLGSISFDDDGIALYEYYPMLNDSISAEQMSFAKGSWSFNEKTQSVTIDWQPNTAFPHLKSILSVKKDDDWGYKLIGENREWYVEMY